MIAGGGGMVVSGSQITDAVLSKMRRSTVENNVKEYKSRFELLMKECDEIGTLLQDVYGDIDANFPSWVAFWGNVAAISGIKSATVNVIGGTVLHSLRIASHVDNVASTGSVVTTTAFKTIGTTTFRALHIAGGVAGVAFIGFDIYTLVNASIDAHKSNPHKTSEAIREIAAQIKAKCPTRDDIDDMMKDTIDSLSHV